ncbi:MAG TPA: tetratricopeptide repeat protein [Gaiellaceae bacterium]|jgi:class 3 adenylate cyclase|nr:tetratricopeptide repeat protein [Gaiellaceae bacterium]
MAGAVDVARNAAERHSWREAYDAYTGSDDSGLTPDDQEQFADAAWWTGKIDEAIGLRERSYAGFSAAGDRLGAARLALTLSWDHLNRGAFAVSRGWFANAERLLEGQPEAREHGFLALSRGITTLFAEGNIDDALPELERAHEIAARAGDRDTQVLALVGKGRAFVQRGDVEQGLAILDEASTSAVSGELRPYATGLVYCATITSCQHVGDYRRAAEWTEAASRWCEQEDMNGFPGACRIHRAEIMRLRGDWPEAEKTALAACEEVHDFDRLVTAGGYYEIGEIRRRRGDFAAAEEAFRTANELGRSPQPGLALLQLAQGKVDSAVAGVTRRLAEMDEPLERVRMLPALAEIALAAGDLDTARSAAAELQQIVDSYKIGDRRAPAFDATVNLTLGQIELAGQDWDDASRDLRRARDEWQEIGAPYETAQARMLLGIAFRHQGDEHAATLELQAAQTTFERLGAKLDEERAKELLGRVDTHRTFLFTDIVGSTRLLENLGDERWSKLLALHDKLVRTRIVESGGDVIKQTGDGFFASFDDPGAAIDAAVAIQRALQSEVFAPEVRIGAHAGTAFKTGASFSDYGGQSVHVAARIGAAAGAGEVLVSRETIDGIETSFRLSKPRAASLKGFEQPVEVVSVDWR